LRAVRSLARRRSSWAAASAVQGCWPCPSKRPR
jgi:hypothetical protein